jgi:hypothetical protein
MPLSLAAMMLPSMGATTCLIGSMGLRESSGLVEQQRWFRMLAAR